MPYLNKKSEIDSSVYVKVCHIFLDFKVSRYIERLQFLEYLRTLSLKFLKARTKIEVVLTLPGPVGFLSPQKL